MAANPATNSIPSIKPLMPDGNFSEAWRQWFMNPAFNSVTLPVVGQGGVFGSASNAVQMTINSGGLVTSVAQTPIAITVAQVTNAGTMATQNANAVAITGGTIASVTSLQAAGSFGVNGQPVQAPYASGGAVSAAGATNVAPYGWATAAQANSIVTLVNNIRAALVANGIMV